MQESNDRSDADREGHQEPTSQPHGLGDFGGLACPVPLSDFDHIIMGHGGGGGLSGELVRQLFLPHFRNPLLETLADAATFDTPAGRLAFTTDAFVVQPLFFPGGSIGDLAVNGTVNDLAMSGARPLYLSAAFIIEEGLPLTELRRIVEDMSRAAQAAGVAIVTGDTKVVQRGCGDGCYITTSGMGVVPAGVRPAPDRAQPGDAVLISGSIGQHGMAIMSVREGLEFEAPIRSDTCPLAELVEAMLATGADIHVLRDPTRGGVAASLNEIAQASRCGIVLDERRLPIQPEVQSACELFGLDPLLVANEGKLLCVVPESQAEGVLAVMRSRPEGQQAGLIGSVVADHPGMVVTRTALGGRRVVAVPLGEQLPRIC